MDEIARSKYISVGTYRSNGSLISTPTWVVPFREGYAFTTQTGSWKTKRLARDSRVVVTSSNFRGRPVKGATLFKGRGELLTGAPYDEVEREIRRKYRFMWLLTITPRRLVQKVKGGEKIADCAVYFVLEGWE